MDKDKLEIYWDENVPQGYEPFLTELVERGLLHTKNPVGVEISIAFVSRDEIQELNLRYRNIDEPTDVLSFPFSEPGTSSIAPATLGDIVICLEIAEEQAQRFGHSHKREVGFLTVHGLLHLLGFDHEAEEDEEEMRQLQREILGDLQ